MNPLEEKLSWMKKLSARANQYKPEQLKHPWNLSTEKGRYVVATDGAILVAVKGEVPGWPTSTDQEIYKKACLYVTFDVPVPPYHSLKTDLSSLRVWAGMPTWPSGKPCADCKGEAKMECESCEGSGSREKSCEDCEESHDCVCPDCDQGETSCRACSGTGLDGQKMLDRYGQIGACKINKEYLARALENLGQGEVWASWNPEKPDTLYLDGAEFRIMVMTVLTEGKLPVFGEPEPAQP